jgi:hypothetical protein
MSRGFANMVVKTANDTKLTAAGARAGHPARAKARPANGHETVR